MKELFRPELDIRNLTVESPAPEALPRFEINNYVNAPERLKIDEAITHNVEQLTTSESPTVYIQRLVNWLQPPLIAALPDLTELTRDSDVVKTKILAMVGELAGNLDGRRGLATILDELAGCKNVYPKEVSALIDRDAITERLTHSLALKLHPTVQLLELVAGRTLIDPKFGQEYLTDEFRDVNLQLAEREATELGSSLATLPKLRLLYPQDITPRTLPKQTVENLMAGKRDAFLWDNPNDQRYDWPRYVYYLSNLVMLQCPGLWIDQNGLQVDLEHSGPTKPVISETPLPEQRKY